MLRDQPEDIIGFANEYFRARIQEEQPTKFDAIYSGVQPPRSAPPSPAPNNPASPFIFPGNYKMYYHKCYISYSLFEFLYYILSTFCIQDVNPLQTTLQKLETPPSISSTHGNDHADHDAHNQGTDPGHVHADVTPAASNMNTAAATTTAAEPALLHTNAFPRGAQRGRRVSVSAEPITFDGSFSAPVHHKSEDAKVQSTALLSYNLAKL